MTDRSTQIVTDGFRSTFGRDLTSTETVDVLRNGDEIFPSMLEAIDAAQDTIAFATFVYWEGDIAEAFAASLAAKSATGVTVRVLIDDYGGKKMHDGLKTMMTEAGCQLAIYNPLDWRRPWRAGHRTHRKTLVVDDHVAFTGGVGIAEEWQGNARDPSEWRDTHFRFTGDVVTAIRATFVDNWLDTTREHPLHLAIPGPAPADQVGSIPCFVIDAGHSDTRNDMFDHFRILIGAAEQQIRLTTAYFVPDPAIVEDLCAAVDRGVDVHLLLPGPHTDKNFVRVAARSLMADLVDRGVKISIYQQTMLHTKVLTVDGSISSIGSANLNRRSGHHDQEANVVIFDEDATGLLDRHFADDLERSVSYTEDSVASPGAVQQAFEPVLERLRPWM